jgi:ribosomal protein S18 acetylase RimI-like enzyme
MGDASMSWTTRQDDEVRYFIPRNGHCAALRAMARACFADTFSRFYDPQPFAHFLDEVYGDAGHMARDLLDPDIEWFAAATGEAIIGYAKLRPLAAPAPRPRANALELQQIYVLREWHGRGIAERLMGWALDRSRALGAPELYLTVFDHNERAKRFYARHGFVEVGRCTFRLGDRIDDDRIWRKRL